MQITQRLMDKAREAGYTCNAKGLYEPVPANMCFTHPRQAGTFVFRHRLILSTMRLTHNQAMELLDDKVDA